MTGDLMHQEADASINALRDRFLDTLEYRLIDIDRAAQAFNAAPSAATLNDLARPIHKLAGVAGSFGHPNMGTLARSIDARISAGMSARPSPAWDRQLLHRVEHLMIHMENVLESNTPLSLRDVEPNKG